MNRSEPLQIVIADARKSNLSREWGEEVEGRYKFFLCHDGQLDVLASSAKFTAAFAGAQGGKTSLVPLWLFKQMEKHNKADPFRALFVSPTVPMRDQSQIVMHIERTFAGTALQGKYNKSDRVYRFPNGAEILFRTADDPASLDAGVYDAVVCDEAAKKQYTQECWTRIQVRASSRNAPVLCVSTPDLACCIYDEFLAKTRQIKDGIRASKDGKYFMRVWASNSRPGFNLEAFEQAKATMSRAMFERMFMGVFATFEGLVYESFGDPKATSYPVIKAPERLLSPAVSTIGGGDFGFAKDPNAFLIGAHCEDGIIYVLDEHYRTNENNDQLAASIIKLKGRWEVSDTYQYSEQLQTGTTRFYCDTEDPKAISTLRQYGINATGKRVTDLLPSIATVNAMFRAGRLKISDKCVHLIDELKRYQWNTSRSGETKDKPRGKDDHLCDALRYMVGSHMKGERITPLELPVLSQREAEEQAVETAVRLGQISNNPEQRRNQAEKAAIAEYEAWFAQMAWSDLDD